MKVYLLNSIESTLAKVEIAFSITSNFPFCHNGFKSLLLMHKHMYARLKGLNMAYSMKLHTQEKKGQGHI